MKTFSVAVLLLIAYGPQSKGVGTGAYVLEWIKEYLVNSRGLTDDRLKFVYGGRNTDLTRLLIQI